MTLVIIRDSDKRRMFKSTSDKLPYDNQTLTIMAKAGYKFELDGKIVSLSELKAAFAGPITEPTQNNDKADSRPISPVSATIKSNLGKKVRCIETGEIYDSQACAAKALNIDPAQVSDSIKTGRKRSGYTFEKVAE